MNPYLRGEFLEVPSESARFDQGGAVCEQARDSLQQQQVSPNVNGRLSECAGLDRSAGLVQTSYVRHRSSLLHCLIGLASRRRSGVVLRKSLADCSALLRVSQHELTIIARRGLLSATAVARKHAS